MYCAYLLACTIQQKYSSEVSGQHSLGGYEESWHWSTTSLDDLTEVSAFRKTHSWMIGQRNWLCFNLCPFIHSSVVLNALTSVISSVGSVQPMTWLFISSSRSAVLTPHQGVFLFRILLSWLPLRRISHNITIQCITIQYRIIQLEGMAAYGCLLLAPAEGCWWPSATHWAWGPSPALAWRPWQGWASVLDTDWVQEAMSTGGQHEA